MQKVITINLNGNAYQLDERGYDALSAYLEHAEGQLGSNPDRTEIVRDLERSVAEKCMRVTDDPPWMTVMMYVLLVFLVPYAKTSAQLAAAQSTAEGIPYRVQVFVERMKRKLGAKGA